MAKNGRPSNEACQQPEYQAQEARGGGTSENMPEEKFWKKDRLHFCTQYNVTPISDWKDFK